MARGAGRAFAPVTAQRARQPQQRRRLWRRRLPVHMEVDVSFGLPLFTMVGLPDASVRESRDRVRERDSELRLRVSAHRITVNLAPADVRKAGSSFDLPSRWACSRRGRRGGPRRSTTSSSWASSRSTARFTWPEGCCRLRRRPGATACRACSCRAQRERGSRRRGAQRAARFRRGRGRSRRSITRPRKLLCLRPAHRRPEMPLIPPMSAARCSPGARWRSRARVVTTFSWPVRRVPARR